VPDVRPEHLVGIGTVFENGREIGEVSYAIRVSPDPEGGLAEITGHLFDNPALVEEIYRSDHPYATLRLEDGRHWDFILQTPEGYAFNTEAGLR
jgi:hypothetical protein